MSVIPFPSAPRREDRIPRRAERIRGIEQCLLSLAAEADELGLDMVAHMIGVAHEAAEESMEEEGLIPARS